VLDMHSITYGARSITFALLWNSVRVRWNNALIYSHDSGDSWCRLVEFNSGCVNFVIANAQEGVSPSLVVSFSNLASGEKRTIIISAI